MACLTHIALHVKELASCVTFYQDDAGMQLQLIRERYVNGKYIVCLAELDKAEQFVIVMLLSAPGHQQSRMDFSHLGFDLASK